MVHLSLDGSNFVQIARDFLLDGNHRKAWRLLAEGLIGDGSDTAARQILMGTHTLTGNGKDGLELEADTNSTEYQQKVNSLYAGRVQIGGTWYKPIAIATKYAADGSPVMHPQDMSLDMMYLPNLEHRSRDINDLNALRTAYLALPDELVVGVEHSDGLWPVVTKTLGVVIATKNVSNILFAPCSEPPHWWPDYRTVDAAYAAFVAAGGVLEVRADDPPDESEPPVETPESIQVDDELEALMGSFKTSLDALDESPEVLAFRAQCAEWQTQILAQNGPDMIDLVDDAGTVLASVPRKPFMAYALKRTKYADQAPWKPVCPSGLKLQGDSQAHTDWYVGYGGCLVNGYPYGSALDRAASHMLCRVQESYSGSACAILVGGPPVTGVVGQDVIVLPNLDPKYLPRLLKARAVITECGGALAHLAQVALERAIPMVLVPNALSLFQDGLTVTVDADAIDGTGPLVTL